MVFSESHYNIIKKRRIENIVKENGRLIFATANDDYDDNGCFLRSKFMERNKEYFKIAEEFVKKYNPDNLSREDYEIAYSRNKLKWQA